MMNHKDAGAFEKRSPSLAEWQQEQTRASAPRPAAAKAPGEKETLVVVSKTKDYIRAKSGFNTSDAVMELLSERIRAMLDEAIQSAERQGRKTVLDRDIS